MAATLVWTADEEPSLAVARFVAELAWADAGPEISAEQTMRFCVEAEQLLSDGRNRELVGLLITSADVILTNAAEKDSECIFAVISNFVTKAGSSEEAEAIANDIADKLTASATDKPALRLKLLICLYNLLRTPKARYTIYMRALNYSVSGKVMELITPTFKRIDSLIREWGIGGKEQRALYLAVTNILKENKGSARESFTYLVKYLSTFVGEEAPALSAVRENAIRAAVEFIKAPDLFQSDLLDLPPMLQLEKDDSSAPIISLLRIFLTGYLDDYLKFHAQHATLLQSLGLVHDENVHKMRLLSLAALAADSRSGEIRYSLVQETLQVAHDDVELWVVRAIAAKLIEAKIDQMREMIIINRSSQRVFGPSQWRELRGKLGRWKENVAHVSRVVQNAKANGGIPRGQ